MNKKIILLAASIILLACNFLLPAKTTVAQPTQAISQSTTLTGFTIVRLKPSDGDLDTMLANEAQKATALGQMPILEFDATWCPPCQAIDAAIEAKNELMLDAYSGTYIIKMDVDEWGWNNGKVQDFNFDGIPVYFKLDADGNQTGEVIDGGAWNEDIPENIAPVMDAFFHGN